MASYPGDYAVPGLAWPGFIQPGEPAGAAAGSLAGALLAGGQARGLWQAGQARGAWSAGQARGLWEAAAVTCSQSALSTQYVQVPVTVLSPSGSADPTGDTVQFSFTPVTYPGGSPATWVTGSWATFPGSAYWAQCLVGPGSAAATALTVGTWQVWVKITDSPEVPVLQPSLLVIT